jgi:hypothetical protein
MNSGEEEFLAAIALKIRSAVRNQVVLARPFIPQHLDNATPPCEAGGMLLAVSHRLDLLAGARLEGG